jgi:methyl-accepting chemotaxis protein
MDEVTQQNSALVEENAASAKSLEQQSQTMDERVSFFRVEDAQSAGAAPRPPAAASKRSGSEAARPQPAKNQAAAPHQPAGAAKRPAGAAKRGPVGRMQAALATAFQGEPDWKEF